MKKTVCIVGGDMRQRELARLLAGDFDVFTLGLFEDGEDTPLSAADIVIFPVPMSRDGGFVNTPLVKRDLRLSEVLKELKKNCLVLGACISQPLEGMLQNEGLSFEDYFLREELIIKNAAVTAEGALEIAMSEMPITLFGCRALVIGNGRVGRAMAEKLYALGSRVTVSARKNADFARIETGNMTAIHTQRLGEYAGGFDLIVNTVPAKILTREVLEKTAKNVLIIDLASKPGGVDTEAASKLGRKHIFAPGLPGKCAPVTSAEIIREALLNIFAEREV